MKRPAIDWELEAFNRGIVGDTVEFICRCGEMLTQENPVITPEMMNSVAQQMLLEIVEN